MSCIKKFKKSINILGYRIHSKERRGAYEMFRLVNAELTDGGAYSSKYGIFTLGHLKNTKIACFTI